MRLRLVIVWSIFLLICSLLIHSCKKEYSCEHCGCGTGGITADAGADRFLIYPLDSAILFADTTSMLTGGDLFYSWTNIESPGQTGIADLNTSAISLKHLQNGVYRFELEVSDACGLTDRDTVSIFVGTANSGHPPLADAGPDYVDTLPVQNIILDAGNSSDPDNNISSYQWNIISSPNGMQVEHDDLVKTEIVNPVAGNYQVELVVGDATGLISKDTVLIVIIDPLLNPFACIPLTRPEINARLTQLRNLNLPRAEISIVSKDNLVFFAGGTDNNFISRVDIWNTQNNNWSVENLSIARTGVSSVAARDRVFFAGGYGAGDSSSTRVDIYNLSSKTWSKTELSQSRVNIKTAVLGHKVFFIGGVRMVNGVEHSISDIVDIYDLDDNSWSKVNTGISLSNFTVSVAGNKIFLAGGNDKQGQPDKVLLSYDETTGNWEKSVDLHFPKTYHGAIAYQNKIYLAGGFQTQRETSCTVEIRDINTNQSTFGNLSFPVAFIDAHLINGKIVFIHNGIDYSFFFDIYDPVNNSWTRGLYEIPGLFEVNFKSFVVNDKFYLLVASASSDDMYSGLWQMEF